MIHYYTVTIQCSINLQLECIKMKNLFRHVNKCNAYLAKGFVVCWRIWMLIFLHSVKCKNTSCKVPCCRDAKVHIDGVNSAQTGDGSFIVLDVIRPKGLKFTIQKDSRKRAISTEETT